MHLEQALARPDSIPDFHYHLGMAYLGTERPELALPELDLAIATAGQGFQGIEDARAAVATFVR